MGITDGILIADEVDGRGMLFADDDDGRGMLITDEKDGRGVYGISVIAGWLQ